MSQPGNPGIGNLKKKLTREIYLGLDENFNRDLVVFRLSHDFIEACQLSKAELEGLVEEAWDYYQNREIHERLAKIERMASELNLSADTVQKLKDEALQANQATVTDTDIQPESPPKSKAKLKVA